MQPPKPAHEAWLQHLLNILLRMLLSLNGRDCWLIINWRWCSRVLTAAVTLYYVDVAMEAWLLQFIEDAGMKAYSRELIYTLLKMLSWMLGPNTWLLLYCEDTVLEVLSEQLSNSLTTTINSLVVSRWRHFLNTLEDTIFDNFYSMPLVFLLY